MAGEAQLRDSWMDSDRNSVCSPVAIDSGNMRQEDILVLHVTIMGQEIQIVWKDEEVV